MKQRTLGKNGLTVSAIGIGCMTIGKDYSEESKKQAIAILRKAYDLGYTMFDTAEIYGGNYRNEELVGLEAVQEGCCCCNEMRHYLQQ